jgi:signal transduction histidine kinase
LPTRLAKRIEALKSLPYLVVRNENIARIHSNYKHSLETLMPWAEKEIVDLEDEARFSDAMAELVRTHTDTIPILARGFAESRKYITPDEVTRFLDEHLRARIGTRLIGEQHLALHSASEPGQTENHGNFIGVIDTDLSPADVVRRCEMLVGDICEFRYGVRPRVELKGELGYTLTQIPMHLEYVITELLKNSFRATIESRMEKEPVEVTIAPLPNGSGRARRRVNGEESSPEKEGINSSAGPFASSSPGVTIRIRDRGGGISPTNLKNIWTYSFTTFSEDEISSALYGEGSGNDNAIESMSVLANIPGLSLAGLGYGLPLGRAYAEYFGGGIQLQSLWGWGTDVYLSIRGVGTIDGISA